MLSCVVLKPATARTMQKSAKALVTYWGCAQRSEAVVADARGVKKARARQAQCGKVAGIGPGAHQALKCALPVRTLSPICPGFTRCTALKGLWCTPRCIAAGLCKLAIA